MQGRVKNAALAAVEAAAIGLVGLTVAAGTAQATEGYFQHGFGARQQALGGAGVADSRDAMALSLNPAGLVDVGRQFQGGISLFMPYRGYTTTNAAFFAAPGPVDSSSNIFAVPNLAYSSPIDLDSAWGVAMYGNGGMNTTYGNVTNPNCGGGTGVFCGGPAGVDLIQAFITAGYSRRAGALSFGVAPVVAIQRFKADGLSQFGGASSDAANLTNRGYDYSYGGGARAGVEWKVAPAVRVGVSGQTQMWMTKFDKYRGLFADQGKFNIPANITAGVAVDLTPAMTVMLDYKRIFYSGVGSVGNSSRINQLFGTSGGPGFGWADVNVFKVGAEWRTSPALTLRAGYAHNNNPIQARDVTLNILAPGVMTNHYTAGFSYAVTRNSSLDFSAMYAPKSSVSGPEVANGVERANTINLAMHQYQFTGQWTYKFDVEPPLVRKY